MAHHAQSLQERDKSGSGPVRVVAKPGGKHGQTGAVSDSLLAKLVKGVRFFVFLCGGADCCGLHRATSDRLPCAGA